MREPGIERRIASPRNDRLDVLLGPEGLKLREVEQGKWYGEITRDALLVVQDAEGQPLQFIITVKMDRQASSLIVTIEPTNSAIVIRPDTQGATFTASSAKVDTVGLREALQKAVQTMRQSGYTPNEQAAKIIDGTNK